MTLFPEMFDSYLNESILGRAIKQKKIRVTFINPRKFVTGKYKKVWPDGNISTQIDDKPYGGGPGMVMRAEPIIKAVESIIKKITNYEPARRQGGLRITNFKTKKQAQKSKVLIINFIPSADKFETKIAKNFARKYTDIIMICGRYEGIDARVDKILSAKGGSALGGKTFHFKKISIGDYVLTGGEIPAMILIDSISRQIEGVLGNFDSREEERISSSLVYTRPEILEYKRKKYRVPKVLLSGDHKKIDQWKKSK